MHPSSIRMYLVKSHHDIWLITFYRGIEYFKTQNRIFGYFPLSLPNISNFGIFLHIKIETLGFQDNL